MAFSFSARVSRVLSRFVPQLEALASRETLYHGFSEKHLRLETLLSMVVMSGTCVLGNSLPLVLFDAYRQGWQDGALCMCLFI